MSCKTQIMVFGEVLFDSFPSGERVLGGAPFNVAWHLQALGDDPVFISRVGDDRLGAEIRQAATDWGLDNAFLPLDSSHPTGNVVVNFVNDEPEYSITPGCAYDHIQNIEIDRLPSESILYHGTLALRNAVSRASLLTLIEKLKPSIFLDVNLRAPWWDKNFVNLCLARARWLKLNDEELQALGFNNTDPCAALAEIQSRFPIDMVILTQGEKGAIVRTSEGSYEKLAPKPIAGVVDTVGAGDAFSAMFIHGLRAGWPLKEILVEAQRFASGVLTIRGATPDTKNFYRSYKG